MRFSDFACVLFALAMLAAQIAEAKTAANEPKNIVLGESIVAIDGPWKFQMGDDPKWADPVFNDSNWEDVAFKAAPGANDGDVGLPGYVPGWNAKGHPGYQGYAWYRIHLLITQSSREPLALLGPWAVDSTYQVYENGALLGGVGDFSTKPPTAYGYHYPMFFPLQQNAAGGKDMTLAIRVWMGPWALANPSAGGIHIAPAVGGTEAISARYHLQWFKIFEGYAVDVVPALLFFLMALMTLCLLPFEQSYSAYLWLAGALVLSGIQRGNQAFFFWWKIETVQAFVYFIVAFVGSLSLGAWMMAWGSWFKPDRPSWLPKAIAALTLILMLAQILGHPWLFHIRYAGPVDLSMHYLIMCVRLAFLLVFFFILHQGLRLREREGWFAIPAMLTIGAVLFSTELSAAHVPGIWFPWGVGLSLSECASVAFDVLLFVVLTRRLWSYARHNRVNAPLLTRGVQEKISCPNV